MRRYFIILIVTIVFISGCSMMSRKISGERLASINTIGVISLQNQPL